jgi:putative ABC transport system permease protein
MSNCRAPTGSAMSADELALISRFGRVCLCGRHQCAGRSARRRAPLSISISVGETYPLLGAVDSPELERRRDVRSADLSFRDGRFGALVDPLMLDQLGIAVGDTLEIAGTEFEARGAAGRPARCRSARLSARLAGGHQHRWPWPCCPTAPRRCPVSAPIFRYKLVLGRGRRRFRASAAARDGAGRPQLGPSAPPATGLGPMLRYYRSVHALPRDRRPRLAAHRRASRVWSIHVGPMSPSAPMSSPCCAAWAQSRARIFVHFFSQIAALAAVGVGIGLVIGAGTALVALPTVGAGGRRRTRPDGCMSSHCWWRPASGFLIAFAFSYLPLQQAQTISPVSAVPRASGLGRAADRLGRADLFRPHRAAGARRCRCSCGSPSS